MNTSPNQQLLTLFKEQPCWMIDPLADALQYSVPSVRRFLNVVGYYSSFTHNGGWYTLSSIPQFNREGLWFYRDIGFSRYGSLTNTLTDLINRSHAGMNAEQLGEKLHCRCHSILVQLCRRGKLQRQKLGRSYFYIAVDPDISAGQHKAMQTLPVTPLPAEIAVLVLVEFVRHPDSSFEQLAKAIARKKHVTVGAHQIKMLFEEYDLKKTI